jgi:uncharacterized protein YecE (DUF72 family)
MAGRILVGTSSWADPGFVEDWYPKGMAARDRLQWYAERFEYVEVNSSFYAIPAQKTVDRWAQITPDAFTFDVKLHRLLSRHSAGLESLLPELRPKAETNDRGRVILTPALQDLLVEATREAIEPLAEAGKLGPFLLQLSPAFSPAKHELSELESLTDALREPGLAIELRNRNWVEGERLQQTCALIRRPATTSRSCRRSTPSRAGTSPTCACTGATPRATSRGRRSPSALAGSTPTTSSRRSPSARGAWPRTQARCTWPSTTTALRTHPTRRAAFAS